MITSDIETLRKLANSCRAGVMQREHAAIARVVELLDEAMQRPALWGVQRPNGWLSSEHYKVREQTKMNFYPGDTVLPLTLAAMIADKETT